MIDRLDTQRITDVLQQHRAATETVSVSADDIEAEGRVNITVLMVRWIQARAAQPVTLLDITHAFKLIADRLQDSRIDGV